MSSLSKINVAILAGGLGTRLASAINGKPKVLAEIRGHPFLEYLLNQLNRSGFKNITLCTGHLADQIEAKMGKKYKNLNLYYSSEQKPLGSGGGLIKALPLLNSDTVLVMNGDSFCDVNFEKFLQFHKNKNSKASLVLSQVSDTSSFGTVKLGSDDTIVEFQEKQEEMRQGLVSAGVYLINKAFIAKIPQDLEISIEKDVFPNWIGKGFYGYKGSNNFIDIGTPETYAKTEDFFADFLFS